MIALVQALLVLLLQSTGLLLFGLLALHVTRRRGPAVQTLIGRASLVSAALLMLLTPLTGHVQPVWRLPAPHQDPTPARPSPIRSNPLVDTLPVRGGKELPPVGVPLAAPSAPVPPVLGRVRLLRARESSLSPAPSSQIDQTQESAPTLRPPLWGGSLRSNLLRSKEVGSLWAAVSALLLLWLAVCQWHLTRLRRTAKPIKAGPVTALLALLTPNPPHLLSHLSVHSPFLVGYHRPVIFLPAAFEADFGADALRAIFVHELAHRDRRDNFWTLAARILTALLWPQPLLWLLVRRLEHLSEDACDEAVLAHNCPPRAYADCLLSLATRPPLAPRRRALNAGVAPFRSSLGRRINHILSAKGVRPMFPITLRLRLSIAALTVAAALGGALLVSSAPAQTQPKSAPVASPAIVGIWMLKSSSNGDIVIIGPQGDAASIENGGLRCRYFRYTTHGPALTVTHTRTEDNGHVVSDTAGPQTSAGTYSISNDTLTIHAPHGTDIGQRISTYPTGIPLETVVAQQADLSISALRWRRSSELSQDQFLAGLTPVQGPGVTITLTDSKKRLPASLPARFTPPNLIHDIDINQVVNELKAAGAEAVAVNDQRLVATSAVRTAGQTIFINNTPQAAPYTVKAIGNPKTLAAALNMPGGVASQIKAYDEAMFLIQQVQTLTLPAYSGGSQPRYAKPVAETAEEVKAPIQQKLLFLQAMDKRAALYGKKWAILYNKIWVGPSRQVKEDMRHKQK